MQQVMLALTIISVLKKLREGGDDMDVGSIVENLVPQLVGFFGKDKVSAEEIGMYKTAFTDLLSLFRD